VWRVCGGCKIVYDSGVPYRVYDFIIQCVGVMMSIFS